MLDDPSCGGGIRHAADALAEYWRSEHRDENALAAYARRVGNRTVFKRLGYLLEALHLDSPRLVDTCRRLMSTGLSPLDPAVRRAGRIVKRWNLRVNVTVAPLEPS